MCFFVFSSLRESSPFYFQMLFLINHIYLVLFAYSKRSVCVFLYNIVVFDDNKTDLFLHFCWIVLWITLPMFSVQCTILLLLLLVHCSQNTQINALRFCIFCCCHNCMTWVHKLCNSTIFKFNVMLIVSSWRLIAVHIHS